MSQTLDHKETLQDDDTFRRVLGLSPVRTVVFDGEGFLDPCPTCGQRAPADPPAELPAGEPVTDVPLDRASVGQAHRSVVMAVEVLDQRRPAKQLTGLVAPRVLRHLRAVPVEASGLRGGARLLSFHPSQPHEGAVEVAGSVRLRGGAGRWPPRSPWPGWTGGCAQRSGSCDRPGAGRDLLARPHGPRQSSWRAV